MKKVLCIFLLYFIVSTVFCQTTSLGKMKLVDRKLHPEWIMQGNIYEVNIRQYTVEGTIKAFAKHLDRLKKMGVQTLWLMPINPISELDRKGSLGSYYAVSDYTAINPEFGTITDFKALVQSAHQKGMKLIIDWVPNHTGADHRWLKEQPAFFVKDSSGNAAMAVDWADTRQLNYKNPVMQDSMIAAMKYWVANTDVDGFRCDVAWNIPASFWQKCIPQLKKMKSIFMLAEGDSAYLGQAGFDAVYPWHMFKMLENIAKGTSPAFGIDSILKENASLYPAHTLQMYFTSNHDENSWNHADYGTFPGNVHAPFAVLTQTLPNSIPLIYGGQEEPVLRALKFFDKDPMQFDKLQRARFYKTLLSLRKTNSALSADASFKKLQLGDEHAVYAFIRQKANKKLLVILNFSETVQEISIQDQNLLGKVVNVFDRTKVLLTAEKRTIQPWGYLLFEY